MITNTAIMSVRMSYEKSAAACGSLFLAFDCSCPFLYKIEESNLPPFICSLLVGSFLRFGHEPRMRSERKVVCNVVPLLQDYSDVSVEKFFQSLCGRWKNLPISCMDRSYGSYETLLALVHQSGSNLINSLKRLGARNRVIIDKKSIPMWDISFWTNPEALRRWSRGGIEPLILQKNAEPPQRIPPNIMIQLIVKHLQYIEEVSPIDNGLLKGVLSSREAEAIAGIVFDKETRRLFMERAMSNDAAALAIVRAMQKLLIVISKNRYRKCKRSLNIVLSKVPSIVVPTDLRTQKAFWYAPEVNFGLNALIYLLSLTGFDKRFDDAIRSTFDACLQRHSSKPLKSMYRVLNYILSQA